MPRTLGIIGYGSFGRLLHELVHRFAPDVKVVVHSSRADASQDFYVTLERACTADVVVPCVPIHAFEATVGNMLPHLGADSILVDVATVKMHTVNILQTLMPQGRWIATHPMFGPESYKKRKKSVQDLRVVVAESTLQPEEKNAAVSFLKRCGFDVVEMSSAEHDKHLAETLFLTHFVGQTVHRAGFDRTAIDTVSFGYLMDAIESVKHDETLFKDVYRYNPFCEEALRRFETAELDVRALLKRQNSLKNKG